jgi:PAS domain S-box-containing protein
MSVSTVQERKKVIETVAHPDLSPMAARGATLSLRSELGELDEIAEQLARTEEGMLQLRMAFEEAPIGMAVLAADGRFQNVNRALCRVLGYSAAELLEMRIEQVTHAEDRTIDQAEAARIWEGQTSSYTVRKRYLQKNGATISARLIGSVLRDEGGEPLYRMAMIEEIAPELRAPTFNGSVDLAPSSAHCNNCRSDLLVRSRWRVWELPLLPLLLRPVRCRTCGHRAFKFLWAGVPGRSDSQTS